MIVKKKMFRTRLERRPGGFSLVATYFILSLSLSHLKQGQGQEEQENNELNNSILRRSSSVNNNLIRRERDRPVSISSSSSSSFDSLARNVTALIESVDSGCATKYCRQDDTQVSCYKNNSNTFTAF